MRAVQNPVTLALVGCGAIAELGAAPVLAELERRGTVRVAALVDPSPARREALGRRFPAARRLADTTELQPAVAEAALILSPARFHEEQACALLGRGLAVWCEKPMAHTEAGCDAMIAAAEAAQRPLAIGHFRRFAPALRLAREWIRGGRLGRVRTVSVQEGGPFHWPAATGSFFERKSAGGGVFLDVGVHVLDVLFWWLGEPVSASYRDDAAGGLEANCEARFSWQDGATGTVRLSRDWETPGLTIVRGEKGELRWRMSDPDQLEYLAEGLSPQVLKPVNEGGVVPGWQRMRARASWSTAYGEQLEEFAAVVRGACEPSVPGREGRAAVRWIGRCYAARTHWTQPWLDAAENAAAARLSAAVS